MTQRTITGNKEKKRPRGCPATVLLLTIYAIMVLVLPVRAEKPDSLTFSKVHDSIHSIVIDAILKQAYAKLGITVTFKELPAARALIDAVCGITDGSSQRIYAIGESYKSLLRVQPPLYIVQAVAYVRDDSITVRNAKDLKPCRVGCRHGIVYIQKFITKHGLTAVQTQTYEQLFQLLTEKRLDAILVDQVHAAIYVRQHELTGIHPCDPPLASEALYHYLHEKHADLVPAISRVLAQMKEDGEIDRIIDKVTGGNDGNAPAARTLP